MKRIMNKTKRKRRCYMCVSAVHSVYRGNGGLWETAFVFCDFG